MKGKSINRFFAFLMFMIIIISDIPAYAGTTVPNDDDETEAVTEETAESEVMTEVTAESETMTAETAESEAEQLNWPEADDWYLDYDYEFTKDLYENDILRIGEYTPREEHKNDELIYVPNATKYTDNGEEKTYPTVLDNQCDKIGLWHEGADIITGIKIADGVKVGSTDYMFSGLTKLRVFEAKNLDTSSCFSFASLFFNDENLTSLDLSNWDTPKVTYMDCMFSGCRSLKSIKFSGGVNSKFNTERVETMRKMFENCASLESLDLSSFNTSEVHVFDDMFAGTRNLRELNLLSFDFSDYNKNLDEHPDEYSMYKLKGFLMHSGVYVLYLPKKAMKNYEFTAVSNLKKQYETTIDCNLLRIRYAGTKEEFEALGYKPDENDSIGTNPAFDDDVTVSYSYEGSQNMWECPEDWYEDYEHEFKGDELLIHSSKGTVTGEFIYIPATVTKDETEYKVVLDNDPGPAAEILAAMGDGLWEKDMNRKVIQGIKIAEGVKCTKNAAYLFSHVYSLKLLDLSGLDTTDVVTMKSMFENDSRLAEVIFGDKFDTSKVTNMYGMFSGCKYLRELDLKCFNTSKVKDMHSMFASCSVLNKVDLSSFDTSGVEDMTCLFQYCRGITELDLSNFNTSNVKEMGEMFSGCSSLTSLDLTSFNTERVQTMRSMFSECRKLASVDLSGFDTSMVYNVGGMFSECNALTELDLRTFDFCKMNGMAEDQRADYMSSFLSNCGVEELSLSAGWFVKFDFEEYIGSGIKLEKINFAGNETEWNNLQNTVPEGITLTYDYEQKNAPVTKVRVGDYMCTRDDTDKILYLNYSLGTITTEDLVVPATMTVEGEPYQVVLDPRPRDTNRSLWYEDMNTIKKISFENGVKLGSDATNLFTNLKLEELDLTGLDTSQTGNMRAMFSDLNMLESVDVSMLDTSNVTNMSHMFYSCQVLKEIKFGNGFNTSKVTDMSDMFRECSAMTSVDISKFNTSDVKNMEFIFQDCPMLTSVNVSGLDTGKCVSVRGMFERCTLLKELDLTDWDFSAVNWWNNKSHGGNDSDFYSNGLIGDSGIETLKLPKNMLKNYDFTEDSNILKKVYYSGTKDEWLSYNIKLPAGVTLIYEGGSSTIEPTDPTDSTDDPTNPTDPTDDPTNPTDPTNKPGSPDDPTPAPGPSGTPGDPTPMGSPMDPSPVINDETTEIHVVKGQKFSLNDAGWESSEPKLLSVNKKNGAVTVKKESGTPVELKKTAEDKARIIKVYITKPVMTETKKTLDVSENPYKLNFNYDSEHLAVHYCSNAPDIATISSNGIVTPVGGGTATINAYVNGMTYSCKLKVTEKNGAAAVRTMHVLVGTGKAVKIKGVNKKDVWESSDPSVAVVEKGKIVPLKPGSTILKTTTAAGKVFTVNTFVEDITVTSKDLVSKGKNKYSVTLDPKAAIKLEYKALTDRVPVYKSSAPLVAYVDADGTIRTKMDGRTTLTAKVDGKNISINVTVNKK